MTNRLNDPLVSVITPTYNAQRFISNTVTSVINQSYSNWEMILIDDHSSDDTVKTIEEYLQKDQRIRLIKNNKNMGAGYARNIGLENARGRYIAFLDSDDQWLPEKLSKQIKFMQDHDLAFSYTAYERVHYRKNGDIEIKNVRVPKYVTYEELLKKNVIGCLTVILDKEQIGDFRMINIRSRQDYALWLNITRNGYKTMGMDEILARYRVRRDSLSSNKFIMAKRNWSVYRKVEKLSLIKSLWYFGHYVVLKTKEYLRYI
ncbi:teichuronic acid biosynthesis glycosyltransferase TuaG [Natronobacillus azotifigens]|uniref:Glycosyltransferase family 2 protein n=1 Tax=Natronobacillus azotifigens TaxID=472978 RepID=A0A9J6REA6_9BACI|nr:glycosyltransferase family 2 protein [Natronobacillus azotifigens]MCZ0703684.1 glycosyltransferase family 2 protein [Natronobacillus azotifigens]